LTEAAARFEQAALFLQAQVASSIKMMKWNLARERYKDFP
jgi:hypothetical protein